MYLMNITLMLDGWIGRSSYKSCLTAQRIPILFLNGIPWSRQLAEFVSTKFYFYQLEPHLEIFCWYWPRFGCSSGNFVFCYKNSNNIFYLYSMNGYSKLSIWYDMLFSPFFPGRDRRKFSWSREMCRDRLSHSVTLPGEVPSPRKTP